MLLNCKFSMLLFGDIDGRTDHLLVCAAGALLDYSGYLQIPYGLVPAKDPEVELPGPVVRTHFCKLRLLPGQIIRMNVRFPNTISHPAASRGAEYVVHAFI